MRWMGGLVGICVTVSAAASCGGGLDSSCGDYYDALVAFLNECGGNALVDSATRSGFIQDCEALGKAPGASNLASTFEQCANSLKAAQVCTLQSLSCKAAGTLTTGTACASGVQCSGGACNTMANPNSEVSCGVCATEVAAGSPCNLNSPCDSSVGTCVNNVCTAYVPQGGACGSTMNGSCAANLVCTNGTCQAPPTQGQACSTACAIPYRCVSGMCSTGVAQGGACQSSSVCAQGLTCTGGMCVMPTYAQAGQACGTQNTAFVQCAVGLYCDSMSSTCKTRVASGGTCVVGQSQCAAGLVCVSGMCQVPDYTVCK